MQAVNQRTKRSVECHEAPDNVRSNFPEVKYIIVHSNFTTCLYRTNKPIERGLEYMHYEVDGKMYGSFNTLPLNQIKLNEEKLFDGVEKETHEQIGLF